MSLPPALAELETPSVVADLERVRDNIERMATRLAKHGVALRPHFKTHKCLEVARMQLAAGAVGLTCATLGEAEILAEMGVEDILIAYPLWMTSVRGARLARIAANSRVCVGVDSIEGIRALHRHLPADHGVGLSIELDCGAGRTGVSGVDAALALAAEITRLGLELVGIFTHGGHGYQGRGSRPGAARDEGHHLREVVNALRHQGHRIATVSAGSTPTAELSAVDSAVTEERPGTYVFGDRQQVALGTCSEETVALFVTATVVSVSAGGQFFLDAGAKALAQDSPSIVEGHGMVLGYPQSRITRLYDHHAHVEPCGGPVPAIGEVVAVVPNHVCPVVNLTDELVVMSHGRVHGRWRVAARGRNR